MKVRKRPVVVDAVQLTPLSVEEVERFVGGDLGRHPDGGVAIATLEGPLRASIGDWIIRGVQGEFYPCKPDVFAATYDVIGEPQVTREVLVIANVMLDARGHIQYQVRADSVVYSTTSQDELVVVVDGVRYRYARTLDSIRGREFHETHILPRASKRPDYGDLVGHATICTRLGDNPQVKHVPI